MLLKGSATARTYLRFSCPRQLRLAFPTRRCSPLKVSLNFLNVHGDNGQFQHRSFFHGAARGSFDPSNDTIYAVSTAPGRAGIAIVRISGPACLDIYKSFCPLKPFPKPRYATLRTLYDPSNATNVLDSGALALYFPAPRTVTGQEVLELHIHGGTATVKAVLSAIPKCFSESTIRYAEPGEFTKRAFQNNRLDLAQVEALSDTLSAETEQQRRAAVRGNSGNLGRIYERWREQLLYARGELEALIDFAEDQHFDESPSELLSNVTAQVKVMLDAIASHEAAGKRGELLKKGIRVSLLGPPNAGKSSLLNQIVGREASIVSQDAGTTRDIVEVSLDIRGYLCTFADTAGLRSQHDKAERMWGRQPPIGAVEQEGIRRAKAKARESDVVIALISVQPNSEIAIDHDIIKIARAAPHSIIVINKNDASSEHYLPPESIAGFQGIISDHQTSVVAISCKDAQEQSSSHSNPGNIKGLIDQLVEIFKEMTHLPTDMQDLLGVTERQRQLLTSCSQYLKIFINEAQSQERECDIVLAAEHLRSAANCLSRITGRGDAGDVEEVLGVVFEKFCVGK